MVISCNNKTMDSEMHLENKLTIAMSSYFEAVLWVCNGIKFVESKKRESILKIAHLEHV